MRSLWFWIWYNCSRGAWHAPNERGRTPSAPTGVPMDFQQTADKIQSLLKARLLDGWEIFQVASRNLSIEVKEQKVDTFTCSEPVGVSVRVLKGGRMGFSFSTSLDDADLLRMIDNALVGAENQTADQFLGLTGPEDYPVI